MIAEVELYMGEVHDTVMLHFKTGTTRTNVTITVRELATQCGWDRYRVGIGNDWTRWHNKSVGRPRL